MDFDPSKDYYSILHVAPNAPGAEVKRAFLALAKKLHPDTKKALHDADVDEVFTALYQEVNEAHHVLSDPALRRAYDAARSTGAHAGEGAPPPPRGQQGAPRPQGEGPTGAGASQQREEELVTDRDLPPVIRSDRGALFVRLRRTAPYVGEDGGRYLVTADGRIKPVATGILGTVDRYVVVGTPGEIALAYVGRKVAQLVLLVLRWSWSVLTHYPLVLSMLLVHWNPLRRLRQERTVIGVLRFSPAMAASIAVLASSLVLLVRGNPALGVAMLAAHLPASALLLLELRAPYLAALARSGYGTPLSADRRTLLARRGFVLVAYATQLVVALWLAAELLTAPT